MSVLLRRATLLVLGLSACLLMFAAACVNSDTDEPTATADWPAFTDPDGRYSLRYPADWYGDGDTFGSAFYSYDVNSATGPPEGLPPGEVKVEAHVFETTDRRFCGASLRLDESGALDSVDPQATETTLGGQSAWELVRHDPDPPLTRIHGISLLREGNCITLVAYYTEETPDEQTFEEIADAFEILF